MLGHALVHLGQAWDDSRTSGFRSSVAFGAISLLNTMLLILKMLEQKLVGISNIQTCKSKFIFQYLEKSGTRDVE